jgi:hypothetical protein
LLRSNPAGRKHLEATVHNELCERLGIEFPIFAFTHCRDVAAAVFERVQLVDD